MNAQASPQTHEPTKEPTAEPARPAEGTAARRLVAMVADAGSQAFIGNLETRMQLASLGSVNIPVSLNDGTRPTCYINCPSRAFLDYGAEELDRLTSNPFARLGGRGVLALARPLVRATGLDRQVQLNNWLVATNILPDAPPRAWLETFEALAAANPGAIPVLRSVNRRAHGPLLDALAEAGLTLLPLRKIFLRDYRHAQEWTSDEAKDARLLARGDLEQRSGTGFSPADFRRAAALYSKLYLEKYSALNPHYSARFLAQAQSDLGLRLEGLFDAQGEMVGVIGRFEQYGTLTGPIVGYDTALPQSLGLYRRLRAINHGHARAGERLYNMSAGAEAFKRLRGGEATVEYMVADFRRAPPGQRRAAAVLAGVLNRAAGALV